jgi:TolA-binding protein
MKTSNTTRATCRLAGLLLIAGLTWAEAAFVILQDGRRIEGQRIRSRRNGDVILTTESGEVTFTQGQYREAWADRPAAIDEAEQHLQAGRYPQAVSVLEPMVSEYRFLGWDIRAMALMGQAQLAAEQFASALATYERLFREHPRRREDPGIFWGYFQALLRTGAYDQLRTNLDRVIAVGERSQAARAQVMRGDMHRAQGRAEDGLLDYLRTVVFFQQEREVQPEALFKAGVILEEMRDERAQMMFRQVAEQYPQSPYANQAREKL